MEFILSVVVLAVLTIAVFAWIIYDEIKLNKISKGVTTKTIRENINNSRKELYGIRD